MNKIKDVLEKMSTIDFEYREKENEIAYISNIDNKNYYKDRRLIHLKSRLEENNIKCSFGLNRILID